MCLETMAHLKGDSRRRFKKCRVVNCNFSFSGEYRGKVMPLPHWDAGSDARACRIPYYMAGEGDTKQLRFCNKLMVVMFSISATITFLIQRWHVHCVFRRAA